MAKKRQTKAQVLAEELKALLEFVDFGQGDKAVAVEKRAKDIISELK